MSYPSKYPTPSPSSDASRSPIYMMLGNGNTPVSPRMLEDFESMTCSIATGQFEDCHLEILEQPVEKFRFRYKSEMSGTHGSLQGNSTEKNRKATYPTVQLKNYMGPAIIRCSLFTYSKEAPEHFRSPHPHRLVMKNDSEERVDPHDKRVDPHTNPNMKVVFKSMGIIHTAKKHIQDELKIKKTNLKLEEIRRSEAPRALTTREESEIKQQILDEEKSINLNVVTLRFDAFREDSTGVLHRLCEPLYSNPIFNLKSAMTGDLKIVRMDHATSPASGGKEIFLLVEKVAKKNIKVQIFEVDENDEKIWSADAKFHESDVHHQYAIVVKTPPYRNPHIDEPTKGVFVALFRPSDGECSEPRGFTYTPDRTSKRKRPRYDADLSSSSMSLSMEIPPVILNMDHPTLASEELLKHAPQVNSDDFNRLLPDMFGDIMENFQGEQVPNYYSLQTDAVGNAEFQSTEKDLSKLKKQFYQIGAFIKTAQPDVEKMIRRKFEDKSEDGNNLLHLCHIHFTDDYAKQLKKSLLGIIDRFKLYDLLNVPNNYNETILHLALRNGAKHNQLKDLPLHHMKLDARYASPLHLAIKYDYGIEEVCTHFKSQNVVEGLGQMNGTWLTPLQYAVEQNKLSAVKLLIFHGAQVNAQDNRTGNNILQTAILGQQEELIEYVLKNTAVNKKHTNYDEKTAKDLAMECLEEIKLFNVLKLLDPAAVPNDFELFESALIKDEETSSESESEVEVSDMVMDIKTEELVFDDHIDENLEIPLELAKDLSHIKLGKDIIRKLYEDLNFGYMLNTDAFEDRNPIQFLAHLAMTNNVHLHEFRATMKKYNISEAVHCIDQLISRL
ncbi:nuclear factor NF-kappa-B p110 subunit-like isoform X2 [Atheta coriaria]